MSLFKAWLSLWIALAMVAGLFLGNGFPDIFQQLGGLTIASVNPATAVLVWLLIFPTMVQIDYSQLPQIWRSQQWRTGSLLTTGVNWLVKPFTMAVLAILFLDIWFAPWLGQNADGYIAGLILLGVAPCTGMVFVWSRMTKGDAGFTLSQVSLNDVILLFAFAPIAGYLLGISGIEIPWNTLGLSTLVYVVVPLVAGFAFQTFLNRRGSTALQTFDAAVGPLTKIGLILIVILLFGFQSSAILEQPFIIALVAVPVVIQALLVFAIAYGAAYLLRLPSAVAGPAALIGTSNFFELAVAIAVSVFGVNSAAAIATVVGVLVEVPIMLALVAFINRTQQHIDARLIPKPT